MKLLVEGSFLFIYIYIYKSYRRTDTRQQNCRIIGQWIFIYECLFTPGIREIENGENYSVVIKNFFRGF